MEKDLLQDEAKLKEERTSIITVRELFRTFATSRPAYFLIGPYL
jgi:hypothetical protein